MKYLALAAALIAPSAQAGEPSFVFRGHQIGQELTTPDRITTTSHISYKKWDFFCQPASASQFICLEIDPATGDKTKSIAGVPITDLVYLVRERKFSMLLMTFPTDSFEPLKDMLIGKYGAPSSETVETYHNRMNAEFQGSVLTWKFAEGDMKFSQMYNSIDQGQLSFETTADVMADTEANRKAAEKAGQDAF